MNFQELIEALQRIPQDYQVEFSYWTEWDKEYNDVEEVDIHHEDKIVELSV